MWRFDSFKSLNFKTPKKLSLRLNKKTLKVLMRLKTLYFTDCCILLINLYLLDLDQILTRYKGEYDRINKIALAKNIKLDSKGLKCQLVSYLIGQEGCYISDWKRLARNIKFDNVDIDIDAMIWYIDCNNENVDDKCLKMLQELEKIKGEELLWANLNSALQMIDRSDCANDFKEWYTHTGETVKILVSDNTFEGVNY